MTIVDRKKTPELKPFEKINIIEAEKKELDNGIPAYMINAGIQDVLKIEFLFNAGGWYEEVPLIAKATNSMLNEGTTNYTSEQIAEKIDFYGGFLKLEVNADTASIVIYTLNKYIDNILPLIKDIFLHTSFPKRELDILKQNNKQGLAISNQRNEFVAKKTFDELLFGKYHPYGYYPQAAHYDDIKQEQLQVFFKRYYNAANCKIIIAGKVPEKLLNILNTNFGASNGANNHSYPSITHQQVPHQQKKHFIKKAGSVQSAIRIGQPLFNRSHPDYIGMQILNIVLGGYFGSRLMDNIREDKGYTYGIHSRVIPLINAGYFFISTEVGVDVCKKAIKEIYFEINRLKETYIEKQELDLVRNYIIGNFMRSIDGPFALSDRLKDILLYDLSYDHYHKFIHTVNTITAGQLQELANKYLNEASMYEVVVGDMK